MNALSLGLIAALCWGLHDIFVRHVSQRVPISACIIAVLAIGLVFQLAFMPLVSGIEPISSRALGLSVASGGCFLIATFALYGAFQRGPVRLVAPLIASYPILSVAWAVLQGTEVTLSEWTAVGAIVLGVSIVAALSDTSQDLSPPKGPTILLGLLAACGFAGTFALGQWAAEISHEGTSSLVTRATALCGGIAIVAIARLPLRPPRAVWRWLLAMGCLDGIALFSVLSAGGLPNATYASVASSIFGLLTIVMAWAFLKERMSPPQWAACLVTFAGVGYLSL